MVLPDFLMAAHDDVDDGHHRDGHLAPAQQLARLQATPAGNQFVLGGGGDGDAMQQTEFLNAQSQRGDVAGITAVVLADFDVGDPAGWTGIYSGGVRLSIAASRWAWPPLSVFVRGLGMRLPVRRQSATLACCQPLLDLASAPAWGRGADPDRSGRVASSVRRHLSSVQQLTPSNAASCCFLNIASGSAVVEEVAGVLLAVAMRRLVTSGRAVGKGGYSGFARREQPNKNGPLQAHDCAQERPPA